MVAAVVILVSVILARAEPAQPARTPTQIERSLLIVMNEVRRDRGLRRLRIGPRLQVGAHSYARTLLRLDRLVHATLSASVRENLAWGSGRRMRVRAIVRAWLRSPPHRRTLLWPRARYVGVGIARGRFSGWDARTAVARLKR